jgi:hypothetical protein
MTIRLSKAPLAFTLILAASLSAQSGEPRWLNDKELKFVFVGREVAGYYANGAEFSETYRRIGRIEYHDTTTKLEGTWTIRNGAFCNTYNSGGGSGCFKVAKVSENCFEYWLIGENQKVDASWIARSWQAKHSSTCPKTESP